MGGLSRRPPHLRLVISLPLQLFHQPPGTVDHSLCSSGLSSPSQFQRCSFLRQCYCTLLSLQRRGHLVTCPQLRCLGAPSLLQAPSGCPSTSIPSGQAGCSSPWPMSLFTGAQLRVSPLSGGLPRASVGFWQRWICLLPTSTIAFGCISLPWWTPCQRGQTLCSSRGTTCSSMPSLHLVWSRRSC